MTDTLSRIDVLRNAAIGLINIAEEQELERFLAFAAQKNASPTQELKPNRPRPKGFSGYPSYLYKPIKQYLTENGCHWESGKQVWFQVAVLEQAMKDAGILKPADGTREVQWVLTKNGGEQNVFAESGGLWSLRRYLEAKNRKPLKQAA